MTTQAVQDYLDSRVADPELEDITSRIDEAANDDADDHALAIKEQVHEQTFGGGEAEHAGEDEHAEGEEHHDEEAGHEDEHEQEGGEHMHRHANVELDAKTPLWLQLWGAVNDPRRLTTNALTGLYDAGKALGNFVLDATDKASEFMYPMSTLEGETSLVEEADQSAMAGRRELFEQRLAGAPEPRLTGAEQPMLRDELTEVFPELSEAADHFRENLAEGSNSGDVMVQKTMQFTVPFVTVLRAMQFGKSATTAAKVGKAVLADMITNATVWDPHEARFGELLRMFESDIPADDPIKPTSEKVVGLLAPYIDYVSATEDEGEWEGRWRNAVDSTVMNTALAPIFFTAGVALKGALRASRATVDTANEMRAWLSGMRSGSRGPVATIEIYSTRSEAGAVLEKARGLAGRYNDTTFERDLVESQIRGLEETVTHNTFGKLAEAITGRKQVGMATGTQVPLRAAPFDFSGTFEGGLTPNARVPLWDANTDEIAKMNAIIGKEWDQDAMAASDVRPVLTWKQKPAKGFQRGVTLFVHEHSDVVDPRGLAVKVRAAVPPEHEFSIRRVNNGFVVDVFPFPNALGEADALRMIGELGDHVDAIPHDYRTVYTTRDQYDSLLEGLDGEVAERAGDQGADGAGRLAAERELLTEARQELRLAKVIYERHALAAAARLEDRVKRSGVIPKPKPRLHAADVMRPDDPTGQKGAAAELDASIDEDIDYERLVSPMPEVRKPSEMTPERRKAMTERERAHADRRRRREESEALDRATQRFQQPHRAREFHDESLHKVVPEHKPNWHGHKPGDKGD